VNPAMEEAVMAWKDARRFVLRLVDEALNAQTAASESLRRSKKRKLNSHSGRVVSSLASPGRRSDQSDAPAPSKERPNVDVGTSDDEVEQEIGTSSESPTSSSSVECPVCAKSVQMARINDHLDSNCRSYLSSGKTASSSKLQQKAAWSKLLDGKKSGKEREKVDAELDAPLPKASYAVLKDKQIRDLLAAHDLSTAGDRSQLIARHERWVAVYNANLDRSPALRKRPAELRVEVRRWEEDRRGARKEPLKADITEYRRANKAEFDKLIQLARPKPAASSSQRHVVGDGEPNRGLRRDMDTIIVDSDPEG